MSFINAVQLGIAQKMSAPAEVLNLQDAKEASLQEAQDIKKAYTQFVGESFYGTMLKSMRKTVGEPAYFHGGQAEKLFQGQLDQEIASEMASTGSSGMAESLFRNQFPKEAALLKEHAQQANASSLENLDQLRQR